MFSAPLQETRKSEIDSNIRNDVVSDSVRLVTGSLGDIGNALNDMTVRTDVMELTISNDLDKKDGNRLSINANDIHADARSSMSSIRESGNFGGL